jgi:hypothetical protein
MDGDTPHSPTKQAGKPGGEHGQGDKEDTRHEGSAGVDSLLTVTII